MHRTGSARPPTRSRGRSWVQSPMLIPVAPGPNLDRPSPPNAQALLVRGAEVILVHLTKGLPADSAVRFRVYRALTPELSPPAAPSSLDRVTWVTPIQRRAVRWSFLVSSLEPRR